MERLECSFFWVFALSLSLVCAPSFSADICLTKEYGKTNSPRMSESFRVRIRDQKFLVNLKTRSGKIYVHESDGQVQLNQGKLESLKASDSPFGSYTINASKTDGKAFHFATTEIRYKEKNTFCNDWFQCEDQLAFYIIQPINLFHQLSETPCETLTFYPYEGPKMDQSDGDLNLHVQGTLEYSLKKQTDFSPAQRKQYGIEPNRHGSWIRYYELKSTRLSINGKPIGKRQPIAAERHALAFSDMKDSKITILDYSQELADEFIEERSMAKGAVTWKPGSLRILKANLSQTLDGLPILGDYVSRPFNPDHFPLHLSTRVRQFICVAEGAASERLSCQIDLMTKGSFSL